MMDIHDSLKKLGLVMPVIAPPAGAYVGALIEGNLLYVAGQLPMKDGTLAYKGKVGQEVSLEDGYAAAKICALNILAQIDTALAGDWSRFKGIIRLNGFVNCAGDFTDHPKVINGASELMAAILGESGKHTRIALGASSLPFGSAVEIDAIIALKG